MGEIKTNDLQEIKNSAIENYQIIKPETDMKVQDARNTWDNVFSDDHDDKRTKNFEEDKENRANENVEENSNQHRDTSENQEVGNELKDEGELGITKEEIGLLKLLSSGELDGYVGKTYYTSGGSTIWTVIEKGNPVRYKKGPGGKFFDGKENVRYEGVKHTLAEWKTDNEKLEFLQKYGWLIENDDVKDYSSKYKPEN